MLYFYQTLRIASANCIITCSHKLQRCRRVWAQQRLAPLVQWLQAGWVMQCGCNLPSSGIFFWRCKSNSASTNAPAASALTNLTPPSQRIMWYQLHTSQYIWSQTAATRCALHHHVITLEYTFTLDSRERLAARSPENKYIAGNMHWKFMRWDWWRYP